MGAPAAAGESAEPGGRSIGATAVEKLLEETFKKKKKKVEGVSGCLDDCSKSLVFRRKKKLEPRPPPPPCITQLNGLVTTIAKNKVYLWGIHQNKSTSKRPKRSGVGQKSYWNVLPPCSSSNVCFVSPPFKWMSLLLLLTKCPKRRPKPFFVLFYFCYCATSVRYNTQLWNISPL